MTSENNRPPLLYYIKCCVSFIAISEFKLESQSGNAQFGSKSAIFIPCDLEMWRMTLKYNRNLFYAASSYVHHSKAMSEFKLELQSGNGQFGSKSKTFFAVWPCNFTDDLENYKGDPVRVYTVLSFFVFLFHNRNRKRVTKHPFPFF